MGTQCWKKLVRILLSCLPRCAFNDLRSIRGKAYHGSVRHCVFLFFLDTLCWVFCVCVWKVSFRTLFYLQFAKDNPYFWMRVEFVMNLVSFRACEKTKLVNSWWYDSPCILVDSRKYWLPKYKWIWKKAESQSMTIKYASGGVEGKPILQGLLDGMSHLSIIPLRGILFLLLLLISNDVQVWGNVWMCQYVFAGFSINNLTDTGRIFGSKEVYYRDLKAMSV